MSLIHTTRRSLLQMAAGSALTHTPLRAAVTAQVESITTITRQPHYYHAWPTLLRRRKDGVLLAVYSGGREGHHCPFGRVELIRSADDGRTWSQPQILIDTPIDDRDAGIAETAKGTLLVTTFCAISYERELAKASDWDAARVERWRSVARGTTPEERATLNLSRMVRSTDGGLTWSAPYTLPIKTPHGPVALSDGRMLYTGTDYPTPKGRARQLGVAVSKDDGLTWKMQGLVPTRPGDDIMNYHEPHAVETADGRLVLHLRNHNKVNERETLQSESSDGGKTWSVPRPIGVWGLPSHLLRLRDGRLLMSYGYRRMPRGNHVRISEDHGRTWSEALIISNDGKGDIGYPSTVELPSGELLTLWYESQWSGAVPVKLPEPPYSVLRLARWRLRS